MVTFLIIFMQCFLVLAQPSLATGQRYGKKQGKLTKYE